MSWDAFDFCKCGDIALLHYHEIGDCRGDGCDCDWFVIDLEASAIQQGEAGYPDLAEERRRLKK